MESVLLPREEPEEEEEVEGNGLVVRVRANEAVRGTPELVGVEIAPHRPDEFEGETLADISDPEKVGDPLPMGEKAVDNTVDAVVEPRFEVP